MKPSYEQVLRRTRFLECMSVEDQDDPDDDQDSDDREDCDECEGTGWVYDESDGGTMTCPTCDGEGKV